MNIPDKWKFTVERHRFIIIIAIIVLLLVIIITSFVMCGGMDKIHDSSARDDGDFVPAGSLAEGLVSDVDDIADAVVGTEASVVVDNTTSIEDIVAISELQTLRYDYNAICRVYEDDGVTPRFYVAYEGTVVLGVNLADLAIDYGDHDNPVITITIPAVEIQSYSVDAGTMEFIFEDVSYNNSQAMIEAHPLCEQDLLAKASEDESMFEIARINTEAQVRALTEPLVEQFYPDYDFVIEWEEQ